MFKFPSYFKHTIKNNKIPLYHGLKDKSLDHVFLYEEITPHLCSEGVEGIWLSSSSDASFTSDYTSLIRIDVPIKWFESNRLHVMNSEHVFTETAITIQEIPFNIIKICGIDFSDKKFRKYHFEFLKSLKTEDYEKYKKVIKSLYHFDSIIYNIEELITTGKTLNKNIRI